MKLTLRIYWEMFKSLFWKHKTGPCKKCGSDKYGTYAMDGEDNVVQCDNCPGDEKFMAGIGESIRRMDKMEADRRKK